MTDQPSQTTKFYWGDIVQVSNDAPENLRPGAQAWIVGITTEKEGYYLENFPDDEPVYTIEYEDGSSLEIYERYLLPWPDNGEGEQVNASC